MISCIGRIFKRYRKMNEKSIILFTSLFLVLSLVSLTPKESMGQSCWKWYCGWMQYGWWGCLPVATECQAATIQGTKFYDRNDNSVMDPGEPTFENHNVLIIENKTSTTLKTDVNGHYSAANLNIGTYMVSSGIFDGWKQTTPVEGSGLVLHSVKLENNQNLTVNFGITDRDPFFVTTVEDACSVAPTVHSIASGKWNDPNVWNTGIVPVEGDWVKIESGHTITVPNSIDLGKGGLCNQGTIKSTDHIVATTPVFWWMGFIPVGTRIVQVTPAKIEIHAASIYNSGDIIGKDGIAGNCGAYDTSGTSIELWATRVVNDISGKIQGGNGGDDKTGCATWVCPARGGDGGKVEIFSGTTINDDGGIIQSGNGGEAIGCHADTYGGDGGIIRIITNAFDSENESRNHGWLITGNGNNATTQANMAHAGDGGDFDLFLRELGGTIDGGDGSVFHWDPIQLKASSNLRIEGSDIVEIYTDAGGSMDLTRLSKGAISATRIITIAAGEGGTVDLRGVSSKVFKASEKIEIFADNILLNAGVLFKDLADAPIVTTAPGKTLYRVALSSEKQVVGEAGAKVSVPLKVINSGPKVDTYKLNITNSSGWKLGTLPSTVTVGGLTTRELAFDVTFSTIPNEKATITVTAISQTDSSATAQIDIEASVKLSEEDLADSDNDGLSDYHEIYELKTDTENADTDEDEMSDGWEVNYEFDPLYDDASEDVDNDSYSNLQEYKAGTDPTNPNSYSDRIFIDLSTWRQEGETTHGNWVMAPDRKTVVQTIDGGQTMFVSSESFVNKQFNAKFVTETTEDDDYIGLVFGFKSINDFYLFDWKQEDQRDMPKGFVLAHVTGGESSIPSQDHHLSHTGYEVLATNLGKGWTDNTVYEFTLTYQEDSIRIEISKGEFGNGEIIFDYKGNFSEGQFGFYNFSQEAVRYGELTVSEIVSYDPNADTDNDGMPDVWENNHGLNPLIDDAAADPDNDGLSNLDEYKRQTDPLNSDTDGDGMMDGWEVNHGLNPLVDDASADSDNDGLSNLDEYKHQTDPLNSDTDGDNMPDGWEVNNGLNPVINDASENLDGDCYSNLQEYNIGTNPSDASSQSDSDGDGIGDDCELANVPGDLDGDGDVDRNDTNIINTHRNQPSSSCPECDIDGDGTITVLDARKHMQMCTCLKCICN